MEKIAKLEEAKKIMGTNFIGPKELEKISSRFRILTPLENIPEVPFADNFLEKIKKDFILILGIPGLTINRLREILGADPEKSEPCFYNQDWYLKERFAAEEALESRWYLIKKEIEPKSRGKNPDVIKKGLKSGEAFPPAVLVVFTFFAHYFCTNGNILWKEDFIWCKDKDSNGDRVYVGRYCDPKKISKNGFNIHRHLLIRPCYGLASEKT